MRLYNPTRYQLLAGLLSRHATVTTGTHSFVWINQERILVAGNCPNGTCDMEFVDLPEFYAYAKVNRAYIEWPNTEESAREADAFRYSETTT